MRVRNFKGHLLVPGPPPSIYEQSLTFKIWKALYHQHFEVFLPDACNKTLQIFKLFCFASKYYVRYKFDFLLVSINMTVVCCKDLRGNPKPQVSPDWTEKPVRGGEHFKEYFRVGSGWGILFRVGLGRGIFLPGYETFSLGISGINLPFIPKQRKWNGYNPW